ncbi:MAG: class I SAM-dependent methyltransferase [Candidatus Magasanikbacteria bacterium]|nr:class I SAM-dependent methyltransferase [Candidatus Magasanikbacteria bacterium]
MRKEDVRIIHKTREDYNRIAQLFASTRYSAAELEKFKEFIHDDQYILDWGCGNGRLLYILENKTFHYYGVDQSGELLKIAKKVHAEEVKKGAVKFFSNAKKEVKFKDSFFDLVFMVASFHHLPNSESRLKLLRQVYKEMKDKARLIITTWNLESNWAREKFKKDWKLLSENDYLIPWKTQEGEILAERYYHYFTKKELKELLKKAGFKIEEMYYSKGNHRAPKKDARNLVAVAVK